MPAQCPHAGPCLKPYTIGFSLKVIIIWTLRSPYARSTLFPRPAAQISQTRHGRPRLASGSGRACSVFVITNLVHADGYFIAGATSY